MVFKRPFVDDTWIGSTRPLFMAPGRKSSNKVDFFLEDVL